MNRLKYSTLFSYGATAIPLAMLGLPLYIYLPTFYAQDAGLSVTLVGVILFLARLTDVVTDPLVGIYSDRYSGRFGKRKPFILVGSLLLAISFYALIHPPQIHLAIWLLIFSMLVYLGWSIVSIPYLAWSAEITTGYHEKTRLSSARELLTIVGAVSALLIPYLYGISESAGESLSILYSAFVITLVLFVPFTLFGVKEKITPSKRRFSFKEIGSIWAQIPSLPRLQSAFLLNSLANALPATLFLFFVQLVLQEEGQTGLLLLLYFASGILGLPFWNMLAKKIGKRKSWMASMVIASVAFSFVPFLGSGDIVYFALISFVSGLSLGADMALPSSIQADIAQNVQDDERFFAGILFGIWAMLTKLALALAVGTGFVILGLVGFEPDAPTPLALLTLSLLYGAFPVVIKMIAFGVMRGYRETL